MTKRFYRNWNWEFDYGVDPLPEGTPLDARYAIAYYDHLDRLYRVDIWDAPAVDGDTNQSGDFSLSRYDYFCDSKGHILQKRSLEDNGDVFLIVDLDYDDEQARVRETAWLPALDELRSIERHVKPKKM